MGLQAILRKRFSTCLLWLFVVVFFVACRREEPFVEEPVAKEYTIAVVLPYSSDMEVQWHRTIDWALGNLNTSLRRHGIQVNARWYNEDTEHITSLFGELAKRKDVCAVIGPLYSANAGIAAMQCAAVGKPLIPASATSEQLMRAFSNYGFLWCLTENDISQCELLLVTAMGRGAKSVSLITDKGLYGKTFLDWFAFQAMELGLTVNRVVQYDATDFDEKMRVLLQEQTDCLICIPTDDAVVKRMNGLRVKYPPKYSFLLFSDVAFLATPNGLSDGMEGIAQIDNPYTGFGAAYKQRYGVEAGYAAAQFYDAVLLLGLAVLHSEFRGETDLNNSLRSIVRGEGASTDWTVKGIGEATNYLAWGQNPHITGASGRLRFDASLFTNVLNTYYCHWRITDGKRSILKYTVSDNTQRTDPSVANWKWDISEFQQNFPATHFKYPPLRNLNVLIVAPSHGWQNYRHQADALALYQLLKANGVSDDRILLILEDDLAFNMANPYPGVIRTSPFGNNVYRNVEVDYRPSEFEPSGLHAILSGKARKGVPRVIDSDSTDNLLIYWVGHAGGDGSFGWVDKTFPMQTVVGYLKEVAAMKRYRKIFVAVETCHAGIFGSLCLRIPGLLCLTATNEQETSKAYSFSADVKVWMSNCFSTNLLDCFVKDERMKIYDLYRKVYKNTIGSHVTVYNTEYFDNLYQNDMSEFLR